VQQRLRGRKIEQDVSAWRYLGLVTEEGGSIGVTEGSQYIVVLRALSSARFLPEEGWELNLDSVPGLGLDAIRVRAFTRWVASSESSIPRELVVEVRGRAVSLDEAISKFEVIARLIATMIGFVANVRVGPLEVHLAYDCAAGDRQRPFLEVFVPDERGAVTEGRILRKDLLGHACTAFLELPRDSARVGRAVRQYELALRQWYLGGEWLALSHLYMAVEALTEAVLRKAIADRGVSEEELARSLDLITDDPDHPRWRQILREQVREQMIFGADSDTYKTAKSASDGLEHGFLGLDEIAAHALKCTDRTFRHVRRTIIGLLGLPAAVADDLMTIRPKDVQSRRKVIRGRLVGAAEDPAAEGELYPRLEWRSNVGSVTREGSTFQFRDNDKFTVRTHPGVSFQFDKLLVYGRLEEGRAPVQMTDQDTLIRPTPEPRSAGMLAAVMPLVNAATASAAATRQTMPRILAFNLFGQGVALFESAQVLINDRRPAEALPALRGLAIIASRFEQITDEGGPGIGIILRIALEMPDELGAGTEAAARYRERLLSNAAADGITIPDDIPPADTSAVYSSLALEMRLANSVVNGTYGATWPHLKQHDGDHAGFYTQVDPGPFTEMIASACVIAQLELLKHAAKLFGCTLDVQAINDLLNEARELNEVSSNLENSAR
jgi:hypothetical protein